MDKMPIFSIMDLYPEHLDEITNDIKNQYEKGISSCVLFSFLLAPEGTPCADKVGEYLKKYKIFSDKLNSMGLECGVLVQSTIGHASSPAAPTLFKKYTNLTDGKVTTYPCPMDEGFKEYLKDAFKRIAEHNPKFIMLDDDFRLIGRGGKGCACEKHMAEFEERMGKKYERNTLWEIIEKGPKSKESKVFREVQRDSLLVCARAIREGIDSVNPSIQGAFCCVGNWTEFGADIAKIMAGKNNKVILRIHNGNYTPLGARNISKYAYRAAAQINMVKDKVDVILAEADTCPRNRYSTSAQSLHTHFTSTLLEGANGAKHFITRRYYEPESGIAYRKILAKNAEFYNELTRIVPKLNWLGCKMPLTKFDEYSYENHGWDGTDGWSTNVLERFGFPLYFSQKEGGASFLAEDADKKFSDEEVYLKAAKFEEDKLFVSMINMGFDIIEELVFETEKDVKNVKMLLNDGTYKDCEFTKNENLLAVKETAYTLNPVILVIS